MPGAEFTLMFQMNGNRSEGWATLDGCRIPKPDLGAVLVNSSGAKHKGALQFYIRPITRVASFHGPCPGQNYTSTSRFNAWTIHIYIYLYICIYIYTMCIYIYICIHIYIYIWYHATLQLRSWNQSAQRIAFHCWGMALVQETRRRLAARQSRWNLLEPIRIYDCSFFLRIY